MRPGSSGRQGSGPVFSLPNSHLPAWSKASDLLDCFQNADLTNSKWIFTFKDPSTKCVSKVRAVPIWQIHRCHWLSPSYLELSLGPASSSINIQAEGKGWRDKRDLLGPRPMEETEGSKRKGENRKEITKRGRGGRQAERRVTGAETERCTEKQGGRQRGQRKAREPGRNGRCLRWAGGCCATICPDSWVPAVGQDLLQTLKGTVVKKTLWQPRGVGLGVRWEGGSRERGYMYTYG